MSAYPLRYAWKNNPRRAELYGRRCRIVAVGRMGSAELEFEDGERVITSRRAVRKVTPTTDPAAVLAALEQEGRDV